jgi:16S rRNA C967 or C1407 C5-methylase (RsmB/RsmF family)
LKLLAPSDWVPVDESSDKAQDKSPNIKLFDYVLVDAECSTDGSLKHMKERLKDTESKREETNTMLTDQAQLADLVNLQKRLIESGYRLLKPGGTLVYSTCSLSRDQNENVVKWLLDNMPDAFLIPVHFPKAKSKLVVEGSLQGTVRFYPNLGQQSIDFFGDGFFLAKLGKRR